MHSNPILRDIVLLGGGHAHAIVIRTWGMRPVPGVRLTLISRDALTPYSGMLPGLISGHYSHEEMHIDLSRLCRWAKVRFIQAEIQGIQADTACVILKDRPSIEYDVLSVDTGSTPNLAQVPGASDFTLAVKPIHRFYQRWSALLKSLREQDDALDIAVVGAGAGGFELLLAMHLRILRETAGERHRFHWIVRDSQILNGHKQKVKELAAQACEKRHIEIHYNFTVAEVRQNTLVSSNKQSLKADEIIWCTDAVGPQWIKDSGIQLDERGFIAVNSHLQSISHTNIFAAGDIASQIDFPRPKAGVFAVRAGPVLKDNLKLYLLQRPLKHFMPQRRFLSILACGERSAIASKGNLAFHGKWVWHWKDRIDRRFMDRFSKLPAVKDMQGESVTPLLLDSETEDGSSHQIRCAGCGGKIASHLLRTTLQSLRVHHRADQLCGLDAADDAAIIDPNGHCIAQSVDQIRSMIEDPYIFAQIAANHALSDIYAMGAEPQSAMALISLPYAADRIHQRDLNQLMQGCAHMLNAANCTLSGGHTSEAADISAGFVINGLIKPDQALHKRGLQAGDKLLLTKAIGSGVILAADMRARASGPTVGACIDTMLVSNGPAADIVKAFEASAMTDITGFGLIGHLTEMLLASSVNCRLDPLQVRPLPGSLKLSHQGIRSTLYAKNERFSSALSEPLHWSRLEIYPLLFDPQTSGGLLAGVPEQKATQCLAALQQSGYSDAAIIGEIESAEHRSHPRITLEA